MTQFLRDQASDSEEVVTPLMLDGTYLSRNFATLGPLTWQPPCEFLGQPWTRSYQWSKIRDGQSWFKHCLGRWEWSTHNQLWINYSINRQSLSVIHNLFMTGMSLITFGLLAWRLLDEEKALRILETKLMNFSLVAIHIWLNLDWWCNLFDFNMWSLRAT